MMKAKIFISAMLLFLFSYSSFSQNKKGFKWGLSLAMNSIQAQVEIPIMAGISTEIVDADGNILTGGNRVDKSYSYSMVPKYYINNDVLLRFEFGITNLNLQASNDAKYSSTHNVSHREITSKIFRYTPGFQWFFFKEKKIESYCGLTASYINYKSISDNDYSELRDLATDTLQNWSSGKDVTPGGFAAGIGALAGFNIYLHKRISLGAELSSSALYYKFGGETTQDVISQIIPNPAATNTNTFTNSYKGFKISKIISSYNISFWF